MITLYQLHWSHYVEKIRWALDFKGVPWRAVDVDPFDKRQMKHLPCVTIADSGEKVRTVPTIHDDVTGAALADSGAIVDYLERTYPTPALYPEDAGERDEMSRWVRWFDAELGLAARRLAYTQVALEHPALLAELFMPKLVKTGQTETLKAKIAGRIIGGVLTQRFRFHLNREDGVYEKLEQCLLTAAERLQSHVYLVGSRFTAADLTLASLMRPTTVVPYFRNHPQLQYLYAWREVQLRAFNRPLQIGYEQAMHARRVQRGWSLGKVTWLDQSQGSRPSGVPTVTKARNDQQPVSRFPLFNGPLLYGRLKRGCGLGRMTYG